jgi:hypothetical protein
MWTLTSETALLCSDHTNIRTNCLDYAFDELNLNPPIIERTDDDNFPKRSEPSTSPSPTTIEQIQASSQPDFSTDAGSSPGCNNNGCFAPPQEAPSNERPQEVKCPHSQMFEKPSSGAMLKYTLPTYKALAVHICTPSQSAEISIAISALTKGLLLLSGRTYFCSIRTCKWSVGGGKCG